MENTSQANWSLIIKPRNRWMSLRLGEVWRYRDLVALFVKRDFIAFYKQTILGPLWYLIQPVLTTLVFTVIFGRIAGISTNGVPHFVFYLAGSVCWNYFAASLTKTSNTFIENASIFGKVYFPRLVMPTAAVCINLVQFLIQFGLFLGVYAYYAANDVALRPNWMLLLLPALVLQMALLGLGVGALVSSLTTKYRDLMFLVTFGSQLWMYATPVVYPATMIPAAQRDLYMLNPMAVIIEAFRGAFTGQFTLTPEQFALSWAITLALLALGLLMFQRIESSFVDTI